MRVSMRSQSPIAKTRSLLLSATLGGFGGDPQVIADQPLVHEAKAGRVGQRGKGAALEPSRSGPQSPRGDEQLQAVYHPTKHKATQRASAAFDQHRRLASLP